jgi:inosose dehydratase
VYEGFELGNKFPRDPDALRAVLGRHGLACVSGWYSGNLARGTVADELAAVEAHLNLLAANGAQVMVYGEVADSIQGRPEALSRRPPPPPPPDALGLFGKWRMSLFGTISDT